MWEKWEHKDNTAIKAEKYKDEAFIDIYKEKEHYEIICSVKEAIIFHTIYEEGTEKQALVKYEEVKKDLENIIDSYTNENELEDLCYEFIEKW